MILFTGEKADGLTNNSDIQKSTEWMIHFNSLAWTDIKNLFYLHIDIMELLSLNRYIIAHLMEHQ